MLGVKGIITTVAAIVVIASAVCVGYKAFVSGDSRCTGLPVDWTLIYNVPKCAFQDATNW
jgi:hypothetical protein